VGKNDRALFEKEVSKMKKDDDTVVFKQFMLHSSLDILDELKWQNNQFSFKAIDTVSKYTVSAFVSAGVVKMLLLHEGKSEDSIKSYFQEIYEYYIKSLLNPFYELNSSLDKNFGDKVGILSAKWLK
jgi:hypothetical protein